MIKGKNMPFVNENSNIRSAIKVLNKKNLGVLIVANSKGFTKGIITDGDLKRINYNSTLCVEYEAQVFGWELNEKEILDSSYKFINNVI